MIEAIGGPSAARSVDAGRGVTWWIEAWALFMKNPVMWVVFAVILIIGFIVLGLVPFLGFLVSTLVAPVFAGSWMLAARNLEDGGVLEIGDLMTAFKEKATPLLVLGALLVAATLVVMLLAAGLGVGAFMGAMAGGSSASGSGVFAALGVGLLALVVVLLPSLLISMAIWFAPALVVFRNVAPLEAMKASFAANLRNIAAFVVYAVIYLIAAILASIPFGLGWIVLVPVALLTVYVSYQDVFES